MTTDIELAQREKFEAWLSEKPLHARYVHWCGSLNAYDYASIQLAWEAYQAGGAELVEALEKAQQRIGKLEKKLTDHKRMNQEMAKAMLTPNDSDAAGMEIAALRQRIAKLESNEIREEGNQFLVVRHPGKVPVIKHPVGELEDYLRQILKADPMATIDIVTHRYYGVGGQFVEDADEYLHEMSIKVEDE
ncbi:Uncharacterised protein [Klebsiella variicola]|uniref:hypothetical protein n=1 Tax=Klebsiella variicola TaxID=244366 RepID=UPI00125384C9|nr:hypothetical protein [Klebsiella variicola]VAS67526.1 Uncharacterised protein [Klebsiella variicola]